MGSRTKHHRHVTTPKPIAPSQEEIVDLWKSVAPKPHDYGEPDTSGESKTAMELAAIWGVSTNAARKRLERMIESGRVKPTCRLDERGQIQRTYLLVRK